VSIKRHNPDELAKPIGFSHAIAVAGRHPVYLAGETALDQSGVIVGDGLVPQFEKALSNLLTALAAAGGNPSDLAKMTIYVVDVEDYRARTAEIGRVWRRLAGRDYPAMTLVQVVRLWDVEALVELDGIAVLP